MLYIFQTPKKQIILNGAIQKSELDPKNKFSKRLCATIGLQILMMVDIFDFVEALNTNPLGRSKQKLMVVNPSMSIVKH